MYKFDESEDFDGVFSIPSRLEKRKLNIRKELVENFRNMDKDFEQNLFSTTAKTICRSGHDKLGLEERMVFLWIL